MCTFPAEENNTGRLRQLSRLSARFSKLADWADPFQDDVLTVFDTDIINLLLTSDAHRLYTSILRMHSHVDLQRTMLTEPLGFCPTGTMYIT
jgi:hypothetical protein